MVEDFKYDLSEKDLFSKILDAKKNHSILKIRLRLDNINKKFWIEAGLYRNITTFKGEFIENRTGKFIDGSFVNSGTWISYPALILSFLGWIYFLITGINSQEIFLYFAFFAIFHMAISISFYNHIQNILMFLANELKVYPSQSEIISNHS